MRRTRISVQEIIKELSWVRETLTRQSVGVESDAGRRTDTLQARVVIRPRETVDLPMGILLRGMPGISVERQQGGGLDDCGFK